MSSPRNYHYHIDPFHTIIPPTVSLTLQPLWAELGITCRRGTAIEAFGDPRELIAVTGRYANRYAHTTGAFRLVTHVAIFRAHGIRRLTKQIEPLVDPQLLGVSCKHLSITTVDAATMRLPGVSSALAEGKSALLTMPGPFDSLLMTGGTWVPIPI